METILKLYRTTRKKFPEITAKADKEHINYWGDLDPAFAYSWFESLAKALNKEMIKNVSFSTHATLFGFINDVLATSSKEVHNCIDVAFVENLFWQVPAPQAEPYWQELPLSLQDLYIGFHSCTPIQR